MNAKHFQENSSSYAFGFSGFGAVGRSTLRIALAGLAIVVVGGCAVPKHLNSGKVLPTTLPFSEAVQVGPTLYLSGQIGNIPGSLKLPPGGIQPEARQVMENIKTSLEAHGYKLSDVVKCTAMLADMNEWNAFNEVYKTYFTAGKFPARSAFGASGLAFNARVEVECIAAR
jgi:2-iminobutanoate/2-iminopropanoate deaminase